MKNWMVLVALGNLVFFTSVIYVFFQIGSLPYAWVDRLQWIFVGSVISLMSFVFTVVLTLYATVGEFLIFNGIVNDPNKKDRQEGDED